MLTDTQLITTIIKLVIGAAACFVAIILWSRTRDTAWMFIVIGIIIQYGGVMYATFEMFGFVNPDDVVVLNFELVPMMLTNLPFLFYLAGMSIMIARSRQG